MAKRREIPGLNIALLDILTGALGAVIILFVTVPKGTSGGDEAPKATVEITEANPTNLHAEIKSKDEEIKDLQKIVVELEGQRNQARKRGDEAVQKLEQILAERKAASIKDSEEKPEKNYRGKGLPVDVGFKFKGKKILFLIDVSGSMIREDRLGQVKAGLKMLITSMPSDYKLDVISYPEHPSLYNSLWGRFKSIDAYNKDRIYHYLMGLRAVGFTPTRDVLEHALKMYKDATDIVLLSDGAPTVGNSSRLDNISSILIDVKKRNIDQVRIHTIGVGSAFVSDKGSKAYVFLQELARDHGGFFVGF